MVNPYVIGFGITPTEYIPLHPQMYEVVFAFNEKESKKHSFVITGVTGSGKTVLLSETAKRLGDGWIIIDLSIYDDLLASLASQLYADKTMHKLFLKAKIDLSFLGIGLSVGTDSAPAYDAQTAIAMMLREVKKQKRRVLVKIDEVANTSEMRRFASVFQIFIQNELPIYLLMAGLPDNVKKLSSDKRSTFLLRTPKVEITPLNFTSIRRSYEKTLRVTEETARYLAHLTKGYALAYQALGSVCWDKVIEPDEEAFLDILDEYDRLLQDYSYIKIWEDLSAKDKDVVREIARQETPCKVKTVRDALCMEPVEFNNYRVRLESKGLVESSSYGEVALSLPRFDIFVRDVP